ncbi:Tryptophan synthase alpha chain [Labilithrix luteola]|uniref:Tryptophan synthase alpha chain n=1 Tax=Labilithrix luteola TaxID=1391654 RepID=A0A0K1PQC7_9BACT|nr:hypothetical protein [Labilithrix luteola]AKU95723.1 Tryptophan synthase alpha chain [Labilithrix luteola]
MFPNHTALMARLLAVSALALPFTLVAACETGSGADSNAIPEVDPNGADASTGNNTGGDDGRDAQSDATSGCASPGDCPAPQTACKTSTCSDSTCGTANAANTTACTDNGGRICDGAGNCVQCNQAADCPAPTTVCKTNTCSGNACGTQNAAKGTACADNGGVVCDGNGSCVAAHCTDGVKDADETDEDCGGASCGPCSTNAHCGKDSDCESKVCHPTAHTCTAPACDDKVQNGDETDKDCGGSTCGKCADKLHCAGNRDCASNDCFGGAPGTCVSCSDGVKDGNETDTDCGGATCDAQNKRCANDHGCTTSDDCQSGFCENGTTCKPRLSGTTCTDNAQCASGVCGVNGTGNCCNSACIVGGTCGATSCDSSGACVYPSGTTSCGAPRCTDGQLTPAGTCNGAGTCGAAAPASCPNGLKCASATACLAMCTTDLDCQSSSSYCTGGQCVPRGTNGALCNSNNACTSGRCGVSGSGHCCATSCPSAVAACGATDCDESGACAYPGTTKAPAALSTPGDCQKVVCNGSGGVTSVDDATDLPTSNSACQVNPACCGPSPLTPCFTSAPATTQCTSAADPASHVCGDPRNAFIAGTCVQCNSNADCTSINPAGTLACNTTSGLCE